MTSYVLNGVLIALAAIICSLLGWQIGLIEGSNERMVAFIEAKLTNTSLQEQVKRIRTQRDDCLTEKGMDR